MAGKEDLLISTSSLATALFISITAHIICGIYCLLRSHFKRSHLRLNSPEHGHHSKICHIHQNPLTLSMCDTRYLPCKSLHPSGKRKSMDDLSNCQCSVDATSAAKRLHCLSQPKVSIPNTNGICSWSSAQCLSDTNDVDALEQSCRELSGSCLNENVIYQHTPSMLQTLNAGYPLSPSMRELYQVTERSLSRTVCNKLVVSVAHLVTDAGDTLYLDDTGISLSVPPGAVGPRQKQLISLVLNWDLSDSPSLEESQSLVSPVVYCGPHGLKLKKSCVLTYKHCAYNAKHLNVMLSETELSGQKSWQPLELSSNSQSDKQGCSQTEENDEKNIVTVTQDECQVNISSFTLYTAIMTIPIGQDDGHLRCSKWLQVAVFSYPLHSDAMHHQTRLYFLNKTPCALQWAIQNESKFGGSMCCPEKVFLFSGNRPEMGKDMLIRATYMSENWELIDDADNSNRVPFLYIWHGKCPYASICFRRKATADQDSLQELNIQFFIYQENMEQSGEKLDLQTLSLSKPCPSPENACEDRVCMKHRFSQININVSLNQGTDQQALYNAANQLKCQRIPQDLRLKLRLLLDPPCTFGNNWKFLASEMGLDSSIPYLSTAESPTEELVDILEQKMSSLDDLRIYLQNMDRLDAMREVEDFITKTAENN